MRFFCRLKSRQLLIYGILTFVLSTLSSMEHARSAENKVDRPNFLVILCDDLGYGDLACFGHPSIRTPNLDRLAKEGVRLTSCYSSAPVCSPSRCGLLTGRTPSRAGIYDWIPDDHPMHLQRQETTIAGLLRNAGYRTAHVGKWHCNGKLNSPEQPQPADHGFDYWFSTQNNAAPTHKNPDNFVRNGKAVGQMEGYSCQLVADESIRWLEEQSTNDDPFFLFTCFHEPHEPIDSPPDMVARYPQAEKKGEALYYANVENMDRAVGRMMKALENLKLDRQTLVYFSSDNGPETLNRYTGSWRSHGSPGPFRGMKLHLYEGGIRVPGILRWSGKVRAGQVSDQPVCSLDLLPTFCQLAGIQVPDHRSLDGMSLIPLLEERTLKRETPLFWHYYRAFGTAKVAMRDGDWKLVAHWNGPELGPGGSVHPGDSQLIKDSRLIRFELFNLRNDPSEKKDLAKTEPDQTERMSRLILEKYARVIAEGPIWNVPPPAQKKKMSDKKN